jgi:hypothetical protein
VRNETQNILSRFRVECNTLVSGHFEEFFRMRSSSRR